jgi:hypothetical protein
MLLMVSQTPFSYSPRHFSVSGTRIKDMMPVKALRKNEAAIFL